MEKIDQKTKTDLFSADTNTVIAAINSIKQKGNKLYIPILFDVLNSNPEKEIEDEIRALLSTVKDQETVSAFVEALENEKYKSIWKNILTACWQNGLDFSNYVSVFVDKIINEDWEVTFEAFTIIDNLEFLPEEEIINQSKLKINASLPDVNEQKAYFLQEVLTILNSQA